MLITKAQNENEIILEIEGRVDTLTSGELQDNILQAFSQSINLVLDMEKVAYVSSAGLRAILIGQKTAQSKGGKMVLKKVPEVVLSVLKTVGFDSILNIE